MLPISCISSHQYLFSDRVSLSCPIASLWSWDRSWIYNPAALTSQVAGITGLCHQAQVDEWICFLNLIYQYPITAHTQCLQQDIFNDISWSKFSILIPWNNIRLYIHLRIYLTMHKNFTFQKLWANIDEIDFLAEIALIQFPNARDECILFSSAAGDPLIDFFKM